MSSSKFTPAFAAPFDEFRGRRVLVTGASSGIGEAVGTAFAELGAHVCLHFSRHGAAAEVNAKRLRASGCVVETVGADFAKPGAGLRVVEAAVARLGGLDLLINVAGAPFGRVPLGELSDTLCDDIVQVILRSVIDACRAALPSLQNAVHPAIINRAAAAPPPNAFVFAVVRA